MEILIMASQLILSLMILVGLHELGHMLPAKWFKMKVDKFSIGFPPKIWGIKIGETEYSLGSIPLGGFVKIAGMVDESMDLEQINKAPEPWEFRSKPAWQRFIVMIGGVTVNLVLGIIIFIGLTFIYGEVYLPSKEVKNGILAGEVAQKIGLKTGDKIIKINQVEVIDFSEITSTHVLLGENNTYTVNRKDSIFDLKIPNNLADLLSDAKKQKVDNLFIDPIFEFEVGDVVPGFPAQKAGLKKGDKINSVNGVIINFYHELPIQLKINKNKVVDLVINRNNTIQTLKIKINSEGKIGFHPKVNLKTDTLSFGVGESILRGTKLAFLKITDQFQAFAKIFRGELSPKNSVGSFLSIGQAFGGYWDWLRFWSLTGTLSMVLAFMNLLPIPALDGGHVCFLLYEMITSRKPSVKVMEISQKIGMAILLSLMIFAIFNDIIRTFFS